MARIVRITWENVQVNQSEYYGTLGFGGEPGKSAEWRLYFIVKIDGKERRWELWQKNGVRDNNTYRIDRQLDVELDGELAVEVEGRELDDFSRSDRIPRIKRSHSPEPGWEAGGTAYRKSARNLTFDYAVHYRIQYLSEGATLTPGHGTLFDVRYSGLWDASGIPTQWSAGLTADEVNAQAAELWTKGGRLAQLQPYVLGGKVYYNVIWAATNIRQLWNINCDEAHFRKTTDETWSWARPHQVFPFVVDGQVRYACLWNESQHGQVWHPNTDDAGFRGITDETWGWARPHQVYAFVVGGQVRYACLWNAGRHGQVWHPNCSEAEAVKLAADHWAWGRAHQIQPFQHGGQRRYSVLWNAGQHAQLWNVNCDQRQLDLNARDTAAWGRPRQIFAPSL